MKLINLRLENELLSTSIDADGHVLDLHNAFDLERIHQDLRKRLVSLIWRRSECYGEVPLPVESVKIVFAGVDYFEVTPRDAEIPDLKEDTCLAGVSRVSPEDDTRKLIADGVPLLDSQEERFHLWFAFRGGQHIRVGADSATVTIKYVDDIV